MNAHVLMPLVRALVLEGLFLLPLWSQAPCTWNFAGSGLTGPPGAPSHVADMQVWDDGSGPVLVAVGSFTMAGGVSAQHAARFDGDAWSALGSGPVAPPVTLAVFDDGAGSTLFAAGAAVERWNGSDWVDITPPLAPTSGAILELTAFDDGTGESLYVAGGWGPVIAGSVSPGIARFDGAWHAVSVQGLAPLPVLALAVFDDGTGPHLYAAQVSGIFRKDGASWTQVGSGTATTVKDMIVHDDGSGPALWVGGVVSPALFNAGAVIARYDGAAWSLPAPSLPGEFRVLASFDDGTGSALFAGGKGMSGQVRRWDGTSWQGLDRGVVSSWGAAFGVEALAVYDFGSGPALYTGGDIVQAGPLLMDGVTRWCGGLRLELDQPQGPGADLTIAAVNLTSGHNYLSLFSLQACPGPPGSGTIMGLCASNIALILNQALLPPGTPPFKFPGPGSSVTFGPFPVAGVLPPGTTIEGRTFDLSPLQAGLVAAPISPVTRYVIQ